MFQVLRLQQFTFKILSNNTVLVYKKFHRFNRLSFSKYNLILKGIKIDQTKKIDKEGWEYIILLPSLGYNILCIRFTFHVYWINEHNEKKVANGECIIILICIKESYESVSS